MAADSVTPVPLSKFTVEAILEGILGKPKLSLRDAHTELVMVDRQRALLSQIYSRKPDTVFSIEDVELLIDAVQEYAPWTVPALARAADEVDMASFAPPPMTAGEMRQMIELYALRFGVDAPTLLGHVGAEMAREQVRLRAAFVQQSREP